VYSVLIDSAGAQDLRIELQRLLRNEDSALHRHGKTFQETAAPAFPQDDGRTLVNIWSLEAGDAKSKKELWCGVEPPRCSAAVTAAIRGNGAGDQQPRPRPPSGSPAMAAWCMHTIVRDGSRVHLGISTGGHYLSEDGGQTFRASNRRRRGLRPDPYPEFGQCVPTRSPDTRTPPDACTCRTTADGRTDPGSECCGVTTMARAGARSRPAFPRTSASRSWSTRTTPDTVYVMPLEPSTRTCPGGAPAIWRSEDGGTCGAGSPRDSEESGAISTIQRDGMHIDT